MIGLGSYAFFWHRSGANPRPIDLAEQLRRTRAWGVDLFQICDDPALDALSDREVNDLRMLAADLGITLQLGTRGVDPDRLTRFLDLARRLGATLVRSMLVSPGTPATRTPWSQAETWLADALPAFADAGVRLALETYELLPSAELVSLIEEIAHPSLGICLDPANTVAGLEDPRAVVTRTAPYVTNVHIKDFRFARRDGWVGFTLEGAPLGTGLLDLGHLLDTVRPADRGIDLVVEHWLPLGDSLERTLALEDEWTGRALEVLGAGPRPTPKPTPTSTSTPTPTPTPTPRRTGA